MFMGGFDYDILIPIAAILCTFIFLMRCARLRHLNARYKHEAAHGRRIEELRAQVEDFDRAVHRLEERIRVLERIITDDSTTLRHEIERLRA